MKSIRSKIAALTIAAVLISILAIGVISIISIKNEANQTATREMELICENQQESMDACLNSVEQIVDTVSRVATDDLSSGSGAGDLKGHVDGVEEIFGSMAGSASGVLTYYYRIAPEIAKGDTGFWYTRTDSTEFTKTGLTKLSDYDADDVGRVGWYYIPRSRGVPSWLDPYDNENVGMKTISYVAPIYLKGQFAGVVGMDVSFPMLVDLVDDTRIYETGYVFLTDSKGNLVYHPTLKPGTPVNSSVEDVHGLNTKGEENFVSYTFKGEKKRAAWTELSNGMRLYVAVPEAEINAGWRHLIAIILVTSVVLLAIFIFAAMISARRITDPLDKLTEAAAQVRDGNYDVPLEYTGADEVGILTAAFRQLMDHLKDYIADLNSKTYNDKVTSVRNRLACDVHLRKLQDSITIGENEKAKDFAVCRVNCDDLLSINEEYDKSKGNAYLVNCCRFICDTFRHSAVFRLEGGEFAVFLQDKDFSDRKGLFADFCDGAKEAAAKATEPWERPTITGVMTDHDPQGDGKVTDTFDRAGRMLKEALEEKEKEGQEA